MRQAKLCVGRRQAVVYADLYVLFAMTPIDFRQGSVGALLLLLPPTNKNRNTKPFPSPIIIFFLSFVFFFVVVVLIIHTTPHTIPL